MEIAYYTQSATCTATLTELKNGIPGISQKVLTDNLRALESDGIVDREVFAEVPPKVVYSLSELGKSLNPLFDAMTEWGEYYKSQCKNDM